VKIGPSHGHGTEDEKPKFGKLEKAEEDGAAAQIADLHGFHEVQDGKEEVAPRRSSWSRATRRPG
jgi:hypothetical protein